MGVQRRSTKPAQVRRRLEKGMKRQEDITEDVGIVFNKPVSEWTFAELQAGRPLNQNDTKLQKRLKDKVRPEWITPTILMEAQKRLQSATLTELGQHAGEAVAVMADLMTSARSGMVRYKAAEYVLNQIMGSPKARVEVEAGEGFQDFLADVMRNPDGSTDILDAEIVDDDDEEDDGE